MSHAPSTDRGGLRDDGRRAQPHALRFAFYGPGGDTGDCWIFWDIAGACPTSPSTRWRATAFHELEHDGLRCPRDGKGASRRPPAAPCSRSSAASLLGNTSGDDMTLSVSADIDVAAADGTRLQGRVIFQEDVAINYISLTACTGSSGGDTDGDGAVGVEVAVRLRRHQRQHRTARDRGLRRHRQRLRWRHR